MMYEITIDGRSIMGTVGDQSRGSLYVESQVLGWELEAGQELMPVTKNYTGIESGTDVGEYMNSEYEWIPYPYLTTSRIPNKNIYELVKNKQIDKNDYISFGVTELEYINKYFDLYAELADKVLDGNNAAIKPEPEQSALISNLSSIGSIFGHNTASKQSTTENQISEDARKLLQDTLNIYRDLVETSKNSLYYDEDGYAQGFKTQSDKDKLLNQLAKLIKTIQVIDKRYGCQEIKDGIVTMENSYDEISKIPVVAVYNTTTEQTTDKVKRYEGAASIHHVASSTSKTPQIQSVGAKRTTKTSRLMGALLGGGEQRLQDESVRPGFTPDDEGNVEVDLSKIANTPETTQATPQQPELYVPQQPEMINPQAPQVGGPAQVTPPEPKQKPGKNDIVPTPQPQEADPSTMVTPVLGDQAPAPTTKGDGDLTFEDFVQAYPVLSIYREYLPAEYGIKAVYDDHMIARLKAVKREADGSDHVVDELSITFDNSGIFTGDPKFWPGVDPDTIFDFERPVIFNKESISTYLSGQPLKKEMYLVNDDVVELNRSLNVKSVWDLVGCKDHDGMVAVMSNVKTALEKDKKFRNKLGKDRMILTSYKDPNNFVMETLKDAPDYYYGPKSNKANVVYTYSNGKVTITPKK